MAGKTSDGILGPGFSLGSYILGFLNVSLRVSDAQLGLDIVDHMWVQFRMGLWGFIS